MRSAQVLQADGVDKYANALFLEHEVRLFALLLERKAVLKSRATAAGYGNAQHEIGIAFLDNEIPHL